MKTSNKLKATFWIVGWVALAWPSPHWGKPPATQAEATAPAAGSAASTKASAQTGAAFPAPDPLAAQAQAALQAKDWAKALELARKLAEREPDKAEFHYWQGQALSQLGRHEEALASYRRVIRLAPEDGGGWGGLCWQQILTHHLADARASCEKAMALDSGSRAATVNLGHTYLLQGDRQTAHTWYQKTIPLIPDEESLVSDLLADFDLFIQRGWQVEASREERAWLDAEARKAIPENQKVFAQYRLADELGQQANKAKEAGQFLKATEAYRHAVEVEKASGRPRSPSLAAELSWAAIMYEKAARYGEAEPLLREVLAIERSALPADHPDIATSLNNLAGVFYITGRHGEAEQLLREALAIYKAALPPGHPDIATSINNLAELLDTTGRYGEAEPLYREALAIRKAALPAGHPDIAASLNNLAVLLREAGRYGEAEPLYRESLAIRKAALPAGHPDIANSLGNLAGLLDTTGRYGEAEPLLREALAIRKAVLPTDHPDIAASLNNLAGLLQDTGRYGEAEPLFREALAIYKAALPPGHPDIAASINNLAGLLDTTGRYGEAEPLYREALAIKKAVLPTDHPDIAASLNNLAGLLDTTGRYGEAEPLYRESLAIRKATLPAGHPDIANSLGNLAGLLDTTGRYGEAEPLLREALAIRKAVLPVGHPDIAISINNLANFLHHHIAPSDSIPGIAISLNNLSTLLRNNLATLFRCGEVKLLFREVFRVANTSLALTADPLNIAASFNGLATLLRFDEIEFLSREALAIQKAALPTGHPDIALSLTNLAQLLETTDRTGEAEPLLQEAFLIAMQGGVPDILWSTQDTLRVFYELQKQRPLAIFYGKQAVNTLQAVRQNLKSLEQSAQQAFLKSKESYYKGLADLLVAEGRLPEAQQVLEMLKQQEYLDFVRRDGGADALTLATLNPFESEQAARVQAAVAPLQAVHREAEDLRRINAKVRTPAQVQHLQELETTLEQGRQRLSALVDEVRTVFAALSVEQRRELADKLALADDRRQTVAGLGKDVALVTYLVLEDQLRILVTTADRIIPYAVPLKAAELNQAAQRFYTRLAKPDFDPRPEAGQLHRWLIAPLEAQLLKDGIHTLMFQLDGILRYLPLAALYDGQHYLAEQYALAVYTAAANSGLDARPQGRWRGVGLGVSQSHPGFAALPTVRAEIDGIIRSESDPKDTSGVLPGEALLNPAFTRDALAAALRRDYPVVHLATHFAFKPGNETNSFLLLGDGTHLDLGTLRTGDYRFAKVSLVTLSACDTALDSPGAKGQEIEGLGTLVQKKGAQAVVASLWPVADASTGLLMRTLYRLRQEKHLSKAEALRQAQLSLLRGGPESQAAGNPAAARAAADWREKTGGAAPMPKDPARPYAHPYYWAPFILMGNWL